MSDMPEQPATTKLDKDEITRQLLDKVLAKLTEVGDGQDEFRTGLATLGGKVDNLLSSHATVASDVDAIKIEQVNMREWKGAVEERFTAHSMRAKQESVHDDGQDTKLQELENRLAAQAESSMRAIVVEMTKAATVAAKTPLGQKVVKAAGYALLAFFGLATMYFAAVTARLQAQPQQQTTTVQLAPAAASPDAGARP